ncbi:gamma-glutamyl-gamma-aminobutyrate hydrolase family protein [Sinomonas mesophila]|uniref:gamma-glutamyl-gamma-aminobutyrate hydrolase family protein n=1 Tax=Sinomonas mesophila TaxID=1531955 RepID=UPI000984E6B7|nr:gamma-glutamyl-gamma-aminobutyrate hydrolase family protein [Sinomonas mesophila]
MTADDSTATPTEPQVSPESLNEGEGEQSGRRTPRIAVTYAGSAASHEPWFHRKVNRLAAAAAEGLHAVGADTVMLDAADPGTAQAFGPGLAEEVDGVLVMGGGDVDPELYGGDTSNPTVAAVDRGADDAEARLVRAALAAGRPVLGICRGLQLVNVVRGGTLHEHLGTGMHRNDADRQGPMFQHDVEIEPGTRLFEVLGPEARVVSGHHQAVKRLGEGLRVSAVAPDGVVEAIETTDPSEWLVGIQWHPEDGQTEQASPGQLGAIFGAFADACRQGAGDREAQDAREQDAREPS